MFENLKKKLKHFWYAGGADVYVNKETGEVYIPQFMGPPPPDADPSKWRLAKGSERKRLVEKYITQYKLEKLPKYGKGAKQIEAFKTAVLSTKIMGKRAKLIAAKKSKELWQKRSELPTKAKQAASKTLSAAVGAMEASATAASRMTEAAEGLAYAAPSPIQVFALAFQKMGRSMKFALGIIFLVIFLFAPWGIFYYAGWAFGAAIMFLLSLIYWVFISIFNGIAYIAVSIINGTVSIIIRLIKAVVEAIFTIFGKEKWTAGDYLLQNALIKYNEIADVPSLLKPIPPKWQPWMSHSIISKVLEITGIRGLTRWFTTYYEIVGRSVANSLYHMSPTHLVLIFVLIPVLGLIAILWYIYRKNVVIY